MIMGRGAYNRFKTQAEAIRAFRNQFPHMNEEQVGRSVNIGPSRFNRLINGMCEMNLSEYARLTSAVEGKFEVNLKAHDDERIRLGPRARGL